MVPNDNRTKSTVLEISWSDKGTGLPEVSGSRGLSDELQDITDAM